MLPSWCDYMTSPFSIPCHVMDCSGLAQKRPRPSLDLSCDSSSSSSSSVTPRPLASVACMSALPPRNFMETKYGKDKIKGSFMNAYWTGETIGMLLGTYS